MERESKRSQKQILDLQFIESINERERLEHMELIAINSCESLPNLSQILMVLGSIFPTAVISFIAAEDNDSNDRNAKLHTILEIQGE